MERLLIHLAVRFKGMGMASIDTEGQSHRHLLEILKKMNVHISGSGKTCLVLLSGSGIPFPKLEYMSLVNELASRNKVFVIEKFGYGFSDITEDNRDVDAIIEEYRCALQQLDIDTPVILVAHSMGFIEALRWSQLYPAEISGLVGLDPATPECYQDFDVEAALDDLLHMAKDNQIREEYMKATLIQLKDEFGFSNDELCEHREILDRNLANKVWISEAINLRKSISLVEGGKTVQIPTLFFISNGEGTTQPTELWRSHAIKYLKKIKTAEYKLLDYPHNLYKFAPKEIADVMDEFISKHIVRLF